MHACANTCIHTYTHTNTFGSASIHTCIHTCMHACIHTHIPTHMALQAYMHTYIHAYTHTDTYGSVDIRAHTRNQAGKMSVNCLSTCTCKLCIYSCLSLHVQGGSSCLAIASHSGHVEVVKYLCALGNEKLMTLRDKHGLSPLDKAAKWKREAVVDYLKCMGMMS
jgi:hypothetical protein